MKTQLVARSVAMLAILGCGSCLSLSGDNPKNMDEEEIVWPVVGDAAASGLLFGLVNPILGGLMMFVVPMTDYRIAAGEWAWQRDAD